MYARSGRAGETNVYILREASRELVLAYMWKKRGIR